MNNLQWIPIWINYSRVHISSDTAFLTLNDAGFLVS